MTNNMFDNLNNDCDVVTNDNLQAEQASVVTKTRNDVQAARNFTRSIRDVGAAGAVIGGTVGGLVGAAVGAAGGAAAAMFMYGMFGREKCNQKAMRSCVEERKSEAFANSHSNSSGNTNDNSASE
jgi:hypothetical protein